MYIYIQQGISEGRPVGRLHGRRLCAVTIRRHEVCDNVDAALLSVMRAVCRSQLLPMRRAVRRRCICFAVAQLCEVLCAVQCVAQ